MSLLAKKFVTFIDASHQILKLTIQVWISAVKIIFFLHQTKPQFHGYRSNKWLTSFNQMTRISIVLWIGPKRKKTKSSEQDNDCMMLMLE